MDDILFITVSIIDSIPSPSRFNTSLSVLVEGGMITACVSVHVPVCYCTLVHFMETCTCVAIFHFL